MRFLRPAIAAEPEQAGEFVFDYELGVPVFIDAATKTRIPLSQAPVSTTVVTRDQILKSSAKTIPAILRLVAGVNVRWNPMMQTITIRGFGQNPFTSRVLLLIDGIPYNSWNKGGFPQQPGFDFFPLENVKQLEVIRGPVSALYGENAFFGVINIATISGGDIDGATASYFVGARNTQNSVLQLGKDFGDDFSLLLTAKHIRSQFPVAFWFNDINDPKVESTDLFVKARYKNLTLSYYRHDDDVDGFTDPIPIPGFPSNAAFKSADSIKQTVDIVAANYKQDFTDGDYSVYADISYAQRDGAHCSACHAAPQNPEFTRSEPHGYQAYGDFRFGAHALPNNDILLGVELRKNDAGGHTEELQTSNPLHGDAVTGIFKAAFYAQDIISLFDDRLLVTLGVRYDLDTQPELYGDAFSPRIAAAFKVTDDFKLRAGFSRAYRFPSFSELYQNSYFFNVNPGPTGSAVPLSVFNPNPTLKRESIYNFDLGAEYTISKELTVKADLYYSQIKDFIVLPIVSNAPPAVSTVTFENHPDDAMIYGGDIQFEYTLNEYLRGFFNWSFKYLDQDGNGTDSAGNPIEFVYAPEHQISAGTNIGPFYGFRGTLEFTWQDEYEVPSFWRNLRGLPNEPLHDFAYLNFRLDYSPSFSAFGTKDPLRLGFYIRNIFNEQPQETLVGVDSRTTGREAFFDIELQYH